MLLVVVVADVSAVAAARIPVVNIDVHSDRINT